MRIALKDRHEVAHYWANQIQSEGRAGNVYFRDSKIYSYGGHFCMGRILPSGVVVFTTRDYSSSTAQHKSIARQAINHRTVVYCNDPADSADRNMRHARGAVISALAEAETTRRIQKKTRDAHKVRALRLAEQANEYLAALPADERANVLPIDTATLEGMREEAQRAEAAMEAMREEQRAARHADRLETLAKWRTGEVVAATGLFELPIALRLHTSRGTHHTGGLLPDAGSEGRQVVQTSHGAEIPVHHAARLWGIIQRVRDAGNDWQPGAGHSIPVGVYTLNTVRADGSMVVGCHDIAYSELKAIADALGLAEGIAA